MDHSSPGSDLLDIHQTHVSRAWAWVITLGGMMRHPCVGLLCAWKNRHCFIFPSKPSIPPALGPSPMAPLAAVGAVEWDGVAYKKSSVLDGWPADVCERSRISSPKPWWCRAWKFQQDGSSPRYDRPMGLGEINPVPPPPWLVLFGLFLQSACSSKAHVSVHWPHIGPLGKDRKF